MSSLKSEFKRMESLVNPAVSTKKYSAMYRMVQTIGGRFFTDFIIGEQSGGKCGAHMPIIKLKSQIGDFDENVNLSHVKAHLSIQKLGQIMFAHLLTPGHYALLVFEVKKNGDKIFYEFDASHAASFSMRESRNFIDYVEKETGYKYQAPSCPNYGNIMSIQMRTNDYFCMMWGAFLIYCICHIGVTTSQFLTEFDQYTNKDAKVMLYIIQGFLIYCYDNMFVSGKNSPERVNDYKYIKGELEKFRLSDKKLPKQFKSLHTMVSFDEDPKSYLTMANSVMGPINAINLDKYENIDYHMREIIVSLASYLNKKFPELENTALLDGLASLPTITTKEEFGSIMTLISNYDTNVQLNQSLGHIISSTFPEISFLRTSINRLREICFGDKNMTISDPKFIAAHKALYEDFNKSFEYKGPWMFRFVWKFLISRLVYDIDPYNPEFKYIVDLDTVEMIKTRIYSMKLPGIIEQFKFLLDASDKERTAFIMACAVILLYPPGEFFNTSRFMMLLPDLGYDIHGRKNFTSNMRNLLTKCTDRPVTGEIDNVCQSALNSIKKHLKS